MNTTLKSILLIFTILFVLQSCKTEKKELKITDSVSLFKAMKKRYDEKWFQNFTFKQHTISFDENEVKTDSIVWIESVSYPYHFRIDRDISRDNYTIYKNDSTYNFKNDTLVNLSNRAAAHLVFKGGLYFISVDEVINKLQKYGYNTSVFKKDSFMEQPVYVIGNSNNQIWLHANKFYCMRRIYTTANKKRVNVVYDNFKKLGKGYVEQKVTFYVDGIKRLEEFYFDIKIKKNFDKKIYDVKTNNKWYLNY